MVSMLGILPQVLLIPNQLIRNGRSKDMLAHPAPALYNDTTNIGWSYVGIRFYIAPRRLILIAIMLIGLFLRLWGLSWGHGQVVHNPGEWAWRAVDHISLDAPVYPGMFNQAFYSLAALFHSAVSALLGSIGLVTGQTRFISETVLSPLITTRLLAALFSTGQIIMAYTLGRRCFRSVGTGMLAAALVACSPVLAAEGHSISISAPLAFMALTCLVICLDMLARPTWRICALGGLAAGFTLTVHPLGISVWPLFICAFIAALKGQRIKPIQYLLIMPLAALLGLATGLLAGCPGLVTPEFWQSDALTTLVPPTPPEGWFKLIYANLTGAMDLLSDAGGLAVLGLWLASTGLCLRRSTPARLLLAFAPVPFILAGLMGLIDSMPMFVASWLPLACVAAGWPLVLLCRIPENYGRQLVLAFIIGALICVTPLWRSLGLSYLFWQQDTFTSAANWLARNKPPQAELLTGKGVPQDIFPKADHLPEKIVPSEIISSGSYVLLYLAGQGDPPRLQRLARFNLSSLWYPLGSTGRGGFPSWLSPTLEIYGPAEPEIIRRPLALFKPGAQPRRAYDLIHTAGSTHGRCSQSMLVGPGGWHQRVLRGHQPLEAIAVDMRNLGRDLAVVQVRQGLRWARTYNIFPGQEAEALFDAVSWAPHAGRSATGQGPGSAGRKHLGPHRVGPSTHRPLGPGKKRF